MVFADVLGILGLAIGIFLAVGPFPSLYKGIKEMEIKDIGLSYLLWASINYTIWVVYGILINEKIIILVNAVLLVSFVVYLNMWLYIHNEHKKMALYTGGIAIYMGVLYLIIPVAVVAIGATLFAIAWMFTSTEKLKQALNTKDINFLNFNICVIMTSNCLNWTIYGILVPDYPVLVCNFIGFILWGLSLFTYYWCDGKIEDENVIIKTLQKIFKSAESLEGNMKFARLLTTASSLKL